VLAATAAVLRLVAEVPQVEVTLVAAVTQATSRQ
jgi:hypothetical protein